MPLLMNNVNANPKSFTVTINPDGTISPDGAPITTNDQTTYTVTSSFSGSIMVERSGIFLDGCGFTLTGSDTGIGIDLTSVSEVTVTGFAVTNFEKGMLIDSASNCTVSDNVITAVESGIYMINVTNKRYIKKHCNWCLFCRYKCIL